MFNWFKPKDEVLELKLYELETQIQTKKEELDKTLKEISKADTVVSLDKQILNKSIERDRLNKEIDDFKTIIDLQEHGIYEKQYKFTDSLEYRDELKKLRDEAKDMISKTKSAAIIVDPMTLNGSASQGRAMQNALIKSAIRGFNGEADALLTKITVSNVGAKQKALEKAFEQLNKLYSRNSIAITQSYFLLKFKELQLAAEYELEKQREKDILREQREKEREEKKLIAEMAARRKEIQKDKTHYAKMIEALQRKAETNSSEELQQQISDYKEKITVLEETETDLDYREGHASAGYVYIISNIGSFGENVFKIGVTRRLDPIERIKELGSASVPFQFDVHAMIFSEDAFALETNLHNKFAKRKVNKVNSRKEYFEIELSEIKEYLEKLENVSVEFIDTAEAFEYTESQKMNTEK
ncbi:DUF4041 domain-containing protein [Weissella ceti]|uniref:DUF4041 domain-containing protein n=1 Tax=Weissella ceti TaxID=759620 RepID=A0ABT3E3Q1_9LACO|nr:DUF4041 domain-containing protein [Weissella ceti]MCW0953045.1 DUF4041 domain-containing protein [Weissella ceti]